MMTRRMVDHWQDDEKSFLSLRLKNQILATIYGGIIGDMIGVPVECKQRGSYAVSDVTGYGTYHQPPGTWSDDTSLTLCLIENIVEQGDTETLMNKFVRYQEEGYWTPHDDMFTIGRGTAEAIARFKQGHPPEKCGGISEYDNGNGALMRVAPLAFILLNNFDFLEKVETIKKYTEITHAHPRSIVGSIIYVELLIRLYYNNSLKEAIQEINELFAKHFEETQDYQKELISYERIFADNFLELPKEQIFSDGYVVHTLEAAIWCLANSTSFKDAVLKAVNLGDDTDTVGFVTGTLAGMYYTIDEIPSEWLEQIVKKAAIDQLLKQFYTFCANKVIEEKIWHK